MTATQLELFPIQAVDYEPHMSLAERFERFHAANPAVADALEALADEWFAAGNTRCSTKFLLERARWEWGIRTAGDSFRLNSNWTAFYARLLIERRPEWRDAFALREQKSVAA
jgi:hypothetical protein